MNIVDDIEHHMGITERWQPQDTKYQEGLAYLTNWQFIRAIEQLQGLVVQRLFELAMLGLASSTSSRIHVIAYLRSHGCPKEIVRSQTISSKFNMLVKKFDVSMSRLHDYLLG
jgi:hypothetical protein